MKDINLSYSSFEIFRNKDFNYLYVDKTEYLYKLVKKPLGLFFLSRPRCFGKSLTLDTLRCIFEAKKELFEGLYISKQEYS